MNSIVVSIAPKWVRKIMRGEKTVEIRKTAPKCEYPVLAYVYCTKAKRKEDRMYDEFGERIDGSVVGRFAMLDKPKEYNKGAPVLAWLGEGRFYADPEAKSVFDVLANGARLEMDDIATYCPDLSFFAWEIGSFEALPYRELREIGIRRAPQSWQYLKDDMLEGYKEKGR